jgi:hypothetical protein
MIIFEELNTSSSTSDECHLAIEPPAKPTDPCEPIVEAILASEED